MDHDVAIIGSGFAGLGAAIRLRQCGVANVVIFERASDLGGTWRDNVYPGCRCDVASNLYSFSFAANPHWSNTYSYQPEILSYLGDVANEYRLRHLIKFEHDVSDVSYDDDTGRWRITTSHGIFHAKVVIMATGGLAEPRQPDIEGLATFRGPLMHTARWDPSINLTGKRVGVIGTGASAVQVIPEIAPIVDELYVFQRTPAWVLPHQGREVLERTKRVFRILPLTQRLARAWGYWRRELLVLGFVKDPQRMTKAEAMSKEHLHRHVTNPELRAKLTPTYRLGCKRVLISNDYYTTFERDNVTLVSDPIAQIVAEGVRTNDETLYQLDVVITATGFFVTDNPMAQCVHGRATTSLSEAYRGDLANYKGTMFPGFPNLFVLGGPNTALGHSSIIFMLESQLNYVTQAVTSALRTNVSIEPRAHVAARWTRALHEKLPSTVWGTGCASWYLNDAGVNTTIWPDFTFKYRQATRHFDERDHLVRALSDSPR